MEKLLKQYIRQNRDFSGTIGYTSFCLTLGRENEHKFNELIKWCNDPKNENKIIDIINECCINFVGNQEKEYLEREKKRLTPSIYPSLKSMQKIFYDK
jgi:hypothetical protein